MQQQNYPITQVCPHPMPHVDEITAFAIAWRYGCTRFPGIREARICLEHLTGSDEELLAAKKLVLGQIDGSMFNDKDLNGRRIPGKCTAIRMADYLGLRNQLELDALLRNVLRVDESTTANTTDLSAVVKCAYRSVPEEMHVSVFNWGFKAIKAVIAYYLKVGKKHPNVRYLSPLDILRSMVAEAAGSEEPYDERVVQNIERILVGAEKRHENCLELTFIARAFKVLGVSDSETIEWLQFGISKLLQQREEYWKMIDFLKEHAKIHVMPARPNGEVLKLLSVNTDNAQASPASRSPDIQAAMAVIRRSSGNTLIAPNDQCQVDLKHVKDGWAIIRLLHTPREFWKDADYDDYIIPGNHRHALQWHMMDKGAMLNGSESHAAEPSHLTNVRIIWILRLILAGHGRHYFERMTGKVTGSLKVKGQQFDPVPTEFHIPFGKRANQLRQDSTLTSALDDKRGTKEAVSQLFDAANA